MPDPEFPDDYDRWSVDDLETEFIGREHENPESDRHWLCDWCSKGISYTGGSTGWHYMADDILGDLPAAREYHKKRPLGLLAAYCDDCGNNRLFFPCEGYMEVRARFELNDDREYTDVEITDISPHDDGIPWDPKEVAEEITEIPFDAVAAMGEELWAPENMLTVFVSADIDIRDLVNYKGEIDRQKLGAAREKWEDFQREMAESGHDRQHFRDSVRGDDE